MNCSVMFPVYALLLAMLVTWCCGQLAYIQEKDPKLYTFASTMSQYFNAPTDLVFVLDESDSVGVENFPTETNFTELVTRMFTISPELARVAVITFSTNYIHFNYLSGNGHMYNFMQGLKLIKYRGGWTHTKEAVEGAAFLMDRGRTGSHKVMVVLTDGLSNHGHDPIPAAQVLKARGYIIFSVGVAGANENELLGVASSTNHLYMIKDFNIIKEVIENLREEKTKASSSVGLHLQYESDDCKDPAKQHDIAAHFIKEIRASKRGKKLCEKSENCSLKQVNITCRASPSGRSRRDANADSTITMQFEFDEDNFKVLAENFM